MILLDILYRGYCVPEIKHYKLILELETELELELITCGVINQTSWNLQVNQYTSVKSCIKTHHPDIRIPEAIKESCAY